MSTSTNASNISAPTQILKAQGEKYAYRRFGKRAGRPLLCLQHFIGTRSEERRVGKECSS